MTPTLHAQHLVANQSTLVPPADNARHPMSAFNQPPLVGPTCLADLKVGASVDGDSGISPLLLPPWMDFERYSKAKSFFEENAFSLVMTWHCSLVMGFSLPCLLEALVFTKVSDTPWKSLMRYVHTAKHLVSWHLGNIWDPSSASHSSIASVRSMHKGVREAMDAKIKGRWITMYDMALVQSGFMGAVTIVPDKFGIRVKDSTLDDYVFFWKCIGYQLGIDDRFNLCSLGRPTSDNIVWEVINKILLPDAAHPPAQYLPIAEAYINGINIVALGIPLFSVHSTNAITNWALNKQLGPLSFFDWCRFYYLRLLLLCLRLVPFNRKLMNRAVLRSIRTVASEVSRGGVCPFTGASVRADGGCPRTMSMSLPVTTQDDASTTFRAPLLGIALFMPLLCLILLFCAIGVYVVVILLQFQAGWRDWWFHLAMSAVHSLDEVIMNAFRQSSGNG